MEDNRQKCYLNKYQQDKDAVTNLFTFRSGGSSGYFSVCEKIKAKRTATEIYVTACVELKEIQES